jgi:hypothetical protein
MASPASDLNGWANRKNTQRRIKELQESRNALMKAVRSGQREWTGGVDDFDGRLARTTRKLETAKARTAEDAGNMFDYIQRTEGNPFAGIHHTVMPGVNPERKAQRILQEQQRIATELERTRLMRERLKQMQDLTGV